MTNQKEITLKSALAKFVLDNLGDMNKEYYKTHLTPNKESILREAEETRQKHSHGNFSSIGRDGLD